MITNDEKQELAKIKEECHVMAKMLKKLQKQEISLKSQNKILAREALNLGYHDTLGEKLMTSSSSSSKAASATQGKQRRRSKSSGVSALKQTSKESDLM